MSQTSTSTPSAPVSSSPSPDRFVLSEATLSDVDTITDMEMTLFQDWKATKWLEAGRPQRFREIVRDKYKWHMQNDPSATLLKITDTSTNTIAASCMWHIYHPSRKSSSTSSSDPSSSSSPLDSSAFPIPLTSDEHHDFHHLLTYKSDLRLSRELHMANHSSYALLVWLMVKPEYRRKGLGSLLLSWGLDRADEFGIPSILEASEEGSKVYVQYGFEGIQDFVTRMVDVEDDQVQGRKEVPIIGGQVMIRQPQSRSNQLKMKDGQ